MSHGEHDRAAADAYLPVQAFLSLYLVLIAFFILLTAMSSFTPNKAREALASVRAAFPSALAFGVPQDHTTTQFVEAERSYAEQVGRLLVAAFPEAALDRPARGTQIEATVPVASLFKAGSSELTPAADKVLKPLAQLLSAGSEAGVLSVECLLPGPAAMAVPVERLSLARASAMARRLIGFGAPPAAIAAGLDGGDGERARLLFYVRPADAPRLDFKGLT
jgi:hypothetical protein